MKELWGGRRCRIEEVKQAGQEYVLKAAKAVGYTTKSVQKHLALNGGRAVHYSRGFLHGMTAVGIRKLLSDGQTWIFGNASVEEMAAAAVLYQRKIDREEEEYQRDNGPRIEEV